MNRLVADHAGREIHVILDNLNTHKPKDDRWLARHKNVHFHFTPTRGANGSVPGDEQPVALTVGATLPCGHFELKHR